MGQTSQIAAELSPNPSPAASGSAISMRGHTAERGMGARSMTSISSPRTGSETRSGIAISETRRSARLFTVDAARTALESSDWIINQRFT